MTTYVMILLAILTVVVAAGLIKVGKVPEMPAFYRNIINEGIFNKLIFKNYFFRKALQHGKELPEMKIENVCSLYNAKQDEKKKE